VPGTIGAYREAVRLGPEFAAAHSHLGNLHFPQLSHTEDLTGMNVKWLGFTLRESFDLIC